MANKKRYEEALLVRLRLGTLQQLREAADKRGQSVSEFVRQAMRKALEQV